MIDIHCHILPGIDDGASDIYDTLEMAAMAADIGVTAIVATPHCNIPGVFDNYFGMEYLDAFKRASKAIQSEGIPIEILPGMEAFATYDLPKMIEKKKIMPLNQSRYILMEFSFDEEPEYADRILEQVAQLGAKPVIAHAERYEFIQSNPQQAYEWRKKGYVIQINKGSFMERFGKRAKKTAYRLLDHNLVSVVASDAHSAVRRTPYLLDAYEELILQYPEKKIKVLFEDNPMRICENKPIIKFEEISFLR
ncbi:MAG: hypothetical protein J5983_07490 [Ruminococcus sp.]|nr:hypothetical protein [Ruminococcus sp.]